MKLDLKEIMEINFLEKIEKKLENIDEKNINKKKYEDFVKKNKNSFKELDLIKSIRKISKTWYIHDKLMEEIRKNWNLDLNWIIEIKEILKKNPKLLKLNLNSFYNFIQLKKMIEKKIKTTYTPEKEIKCTEIIFERNDNYEILF